MAGNEGKGKGWINRIWLSSSLEKKMRFFSMLAGAMVLLSVLTNILVAGFGIGGFGAILESNSHSLAFWSTMDAESKSFEAFLRNRSEDNWQKYEEACQKTERAVKRLPFNYETIGSSRYAATWSILNTYDNYVKARDAFLLLDDEDPDYAKEFNWVTRIQGYLGSYAGRLEQITVEMGTEKYHTLRPLFGIVLTVSMMWALAVLLVVYRLDRSVRKSIINPVVELAEDSRRVGENDFSGRISQPDDQDEVARLVYAFVTMKKSTEGYIRTLQEKHEIEKRLDAVRLQLLKNQINPHFLFNTLNMIASTAQIEDAATTEKMITALGRLFRYNLKSTEAVTPLERELKVVQDYMYLQQMRFGPRIGYTLDCSEEASEILIPAFSMQPLVENAIIHGLSSKSQGGRIHIRVRLNGKRLTISVADTGVGMSGERLTRLLHVLEHGDDGHAGIGLGNIYRRIQSMYGDGQVLVDSVQGRGTVIRLLFTPD